jgi:Tetratricopeptide repeat
MTPRQRPGNITQTTTSGDNIAHSGSGDINVHVERRYVLEDFPAPALAAAHEVPLSRLLAADLQVVPFDPRRGPDLDQLVQWRDRPEPLHVMLVSGPGGQGKTRLAGEFASRCGKAGWAVAAARHATDLKPDTVPLANYSRVSGRLLVVDYAERWPVDDLQRLFADPFVRQGTPTRMLLVARPAGRWWESLQGQLFGRMPDPHHLRLSPLADGPVNRRAAFEHARDAFAAALGLSDANHIAPPGSLDDPAFGLALSLHMAALCAVDASARGEPAPTNPAELTAYLIRREYAYWVRMRRAGNIRTTEPDMASLTFTATLTGPMPWAAGEQVLTAAGLADRADITRPLLRDHRACYPPGQADAGTVLEPLYPDRLGEDFVAVHLTGGTSGLDLADGSLDAISAALVSPATSGQPPAHARQIITVLVETARRWPHVAKGYLYPLLHESPALAFAAGGATLAALAEIADLGLLSRLEPELPPSRRAELDFAVAVITRRLTEHRLATASNPAARARLHAVLGWRLFNAGLYTDAVTAIIESVCHYRELADARPADFQPELARALYDLSVLLSALNRMESLAFGWEAVHQYARLTQADPAAFEAELAQALYFLSVMLSDLGLSQTALAIAGQAVAVYQRLTEAGQAGLEPDLARTLSSLSGLHASLGQAEEALGPVERAVKAYRRLAEAHPASFAEDLARALYDLSGILRSLGRAAEALTAAQQAVAAYRRSAEANPAALGIGLGEALYLLASLAWQMGRKDDAVATIQEAVRAGEAVPAGSPGLNQFLRSARGTLARLLSDLGRPEEALAAAVPAAPAASEDDSFEYRRELRPEDVLAVTCQAVQSYRVLSAAEPARFSPGLALTLRDLSGPLSELGRPEEALAPKSEAVRIYEGLADGNPGVFAPLLAETRHELSRLLSGLGRAEEALVASVETVRAYRQLAADDPASFTPALAQALHTWSQVLSGLERPAETLAASLETVRVYSELTVTDPVWVTGLAPALRSLAGALSGVGRPQEALTAAQEAVDLSQGLLRDATDTLDLGLAEALNELPGPLWRLGHRGEALAGAQEMADVYRRLAAGNPAVYARAFTARLHTVAGMLRDLGRPEEALAAAREAVQLCERVARGYPTVFPSAAVTALGDLSARLPGMGPGEDPFTAVEALLRAGEAAARRNGLVFVVALRDRDDAVGLARLLGDTQLSHAETATRFLSPPFPGPELFTGAAAAWHAENVPRDAAVVYLLNHEPGLRHLLPDVAGTFYVGVPDQSVGREYGDQARVFPGTGALDFAATLMADYSHPAALHGALFDSDEAVRMLALSRDFPIQLLEPDSEDRPAGPFAAAKLTLESQQRARSAYQPPASAALS